MGTVYTKMGFVVFTQLLPVLLIYVVAQVACLPLINQASEPYNKGDGLVIEGNYTIEEKPGVFSKLEQQNNTCPPCEKGETLLTNSTASIPCLCSICAPGEYLDAYDDNCMPCDCCNKTNTYTEEEFWGHEQNVCKAVFEHHICDTDVAFTVLDCPSEPPYFPPPKPPPTQRPAHTTHIPPTTVQFPWQYIVIGLVLICPVGIIGTVFYVRKRKKLSQPGDDRERLIDETNKLSEEESGGGNSGQQVEDEEKEEEGINDNVACTDGACGASSDHAEEGHIHNVLVHNNPESDEEAHSDRHPQHGGDGNGAQGDDIATTDYKCASSAEYAEGELVHSDRVHGSPGSKDNSTPWDPVEEEMYADQQQGGDGHGPPDLGQLGTSDGSPHSRQYHLGDDSYQPVHPSNEFQPQARGQPNSQSSEGASVCVHGGTLSAQQQGGNQAQLTDQNDQQQGWNQGQVIDYDQNDETFHKTPVGSTTAQESGDITEESFDSVGTIIKPGHQETDGGAQSREDGEQVTGDGSTFTVRAVVDRETGEATQSAVIGLEAGQPPQGAVIEQEARQPTQGAVIEREALEPTQGAVIGQEADSQEQGAAVSAGYSASSATSTDKSSQANQTEKGVSSSDIPGKVMPDSNDDVLDSLSALNSDSVMSALMGPGNLPLASSSQQKLTNQMQPQASGGSVRLHQSHDVVYPTVKVNAQDSQCQVVDSSVGTLPPVPPAFQSDQVPGEQATPNAKNEQALTDAVNEQPLPSATDEQAPPSVTDEQAPPSVTDEQAPPSVINEQVPPGATDEQAPPGATDEQVPPSATDEQAPPSVTDEQALPSATDQQAPSSATDEQPLPGAADKQAPPSATDEQAPPSATDEQAPPSVINEQVLPGATDEQAGAGFA